MRQYKSREAYLKLSRLHVCIFYKNKVFKLMNTNIHRVQIDNKKKIGTYSSNL